VALHCELARLDAVATRAVGTFDASRQWEATGARAAAAWIAVECKLPSSTARRRVRLARALRHMPTTEAEWLGGAINDFHVGLLAKAQSRAPKDFAASEEHLVDWAKRFRFRHFAQVLAYWVQRADPDGDERNAQKQHDSRRASLSKSFGGMWFLDAVFDPIGGEIVATALRKIEDELFAGDWAEAKARVGEGVCVNDLRRNAQQRRADAFVEMARRAMAMVPGSRLPDPLFVAFVDHPDTTKRICELASGTVVSPGSLVPWLDEAWIERVVWDGPSRILDIGERRRLFRGATRDAVQIRERECFHPYCEERAEYCEVDHIVPYSEGGLTIQTNGQPGCDFHNRDKGSERGPPP
jgi:hypothetical protein